MEFAAYQHAAEETSKLRLEGPQGPIAPMLGMASQTGVILNVYKKYLRDGIDLAASRAFLKEELGDLLWYLTVVATACQLGLEEIAEANLLKTHDRYPSQPLREQLLKLPILDIKYPEQERFPRRLVVEFIERRLAGGSATAHLRLVSAEPNAFPNGPMTTDGKESGFRVGEPLGAPLTDNSRRMDAYRFHDAIHMGFMAVLGWSPTMRTLLRLKRKSSPATDEADDGARAVFAEEGLSAVLSRLAERRIGFLKETSVDGDAIVVAKAAVVDLEVDTLPSWSWRPAISQGFLAMRQLSDNGGGYLVADLNERQLSYHKVI